MSSSENINNVLKEILARFQSNAPFDAQEKIGKNKETAGQSVGLNPSQAIVIGGLLAGVLQVDSVLIDRNQAIEIVLTGSLKRKTELEKLLDQIGSMPFDDVVKALLGRL